MSRKREEACALQLPSRRRFWSRSKVMFQLPTVEQEPARAETIPHAERQPPISRKVVVIDDNGDAADTMARLIRTFGCDSQVAYDGESGVERAPSDRPDVIFLDIGMPGLDGYEICRRIRAQAGPAPLIVALTGWGQEHDKRRAAAGFDAHLTKPADPRTIEELLRRIRGVAVDCSSLSLGLPALSLDEISEPREA